MTGHTTSSRLNVSRRAYGFLVSILTAWACAATASAQPVTTIITHGFDADIGVPGKSDWMRKMGEAIVSRAGGGVVYYYDLNSGQWLVHTGTRNAAKPMVLVFNWVESSDTNLSVPGENWAYAEAAADALYAALRHPLGAGITGTSLFQSRVVHFIGHSRGCSVNSEVIRRLAASSPPIGVDQVTTLDPHPVDGLSGGDFFNWGDPMPRRWNNTSWGDNYWRSDGGLTDFDGRSLPDVVNTQLSEAALSGHGYLSEHSDVHLWYHGTIDRSTTADDGSGNTLTAAVRADWYAPEGCTLSQCEQGYHYAAVPWWPNAPPRDSLGTGSSPGSFPVLFNGTFDDQGDIETVAGWLFYDGVFNNLSLIDALGDDPHARIGLLPGSNIAPSIVHNRFFLPASATELRFDYRVITASSDDKLKVALLDIAGNPVAVGTEVGLSATGSWSTVTFPVAASTDRWYRLRLEITSTTGGITATVDLDDIEFNQALPPGYPPGTKSWDGGAGTFNWNDANNWNPNGLPAATDNVIINISGSPTILHTSGTHTVASLVCNERMTVSGGTLILNGPSSFANGFTLSGGDIGGVGPINIASTMNWTSGQLYGGGTLNIPAGATLNIAGSGSKYLDTYALHNSGTVNWSGTGPIFHQGTNPAVNNLSGGVLDFSASAALETSGSTGLLLTNQGTMRKTSTSTTELWEVLLTNTGAIQIQGGTIMFLYDSAFNTISGSCSVSTGATLAFNDNYGTALPVNGVIVGGTVHIVDGRISGTFAATGTVSWTSGYLQSPGSLTIPTGAVLNISGNGTKRLENYVINNSGVINWTGTGSLEHNGTSPTINNFAGGLFDISATAQLATNTSDGLVLANAGTLRKTGTSTVELWEVLLTNTGIIQVQGGTMMFLYDSVFNTTSGSCSVSTGATLAFNDNYTTPIPVNGVINGGTVHLMDGRISGTFTATGTVNWTGGYLQSPGSLTIPSGAVLNISGSAEKRLENYVIQNSGMINWTGTGPLEHSGTTPTINNYPGGLFDISATAMAETNTSDGLILANAGILRKSGTGTIELWEVLLTNTGDIQVQGGTMVFLYDSVFNTIGGTCSVNSGATLAFHDNYGTAIPVNGIIAGGTVHIVDGRISGTFTATGTVNWTGGYLQSPGGLTIPSGAVLNISGTGGKRLENYVVHNSGVINWTGTGTLEHMGATPTINNLAGGVIDFSAAATLATESSNGLLLINQGTLRKTGTTTINAEEVLVTNTGVFEALGGLLNFTSASTFSQSGGITKLAGGAITLAGSPLAVVGGSLAGVGNLTANVTNSATCSPGLSAGQLAITGTYSQTAAGTLAIEIGGSAAGSQHDWLSVTGNASCGGAVAVSFMNGYNPPVNSVYTFLTCGTRNGTFSSIVAPGFSCQLEYGATSVSLRVLQGPVAFDGASGGLWSQASNWSNDQVPTATTSVVIPTGKNVVINVANAVAQYVNIQSGGTLTFTAGALAAPNVVVQNGGQIAGHGQIGGDVFNSGALGPGSPIGTLAISGNYQQTALGALAMQIGGTSPGTQHDVLSVSGTATLAGTETITLANGFMPAIGQSFNVLTAGSRSGLFTTVSPPLLAGGAALRTFYPVFPATPGVQHKALKAGDVDGNGSVNTDDLLALLGAWGACPPSPANCAADIAPLPAGNGQVDTDDLLMMLSSWG